MKRNRLSRREVLAAGLATVTGLLLPGCQTELPPTYGNILRMGDGLTYLAHRTLLPGQALAKEYSFKDISSFPAIGTTNPALEGTRGYYDKYGSLRDNLFKDWRISIEGKVARPGFYTIEDLKRFPAQKQITKHVCEEGWSAIAEWNGVQLSRILEAAGILTSARYVHFIAVDGFCDGIDMIDALHPQTILAYGMNGKDLLVQHGAPVRTRVETQLGYKSIKFLNRILVTDEFDDLGKFGPIQNGWSWYAGI